MLQSSTTVSLHAVACVQRHKGKSADRSRRPKEKSEFHAMNRRDWINSGLIIFGLLILAILGAQSRRNCEIPGSSWVPCIWGEPLKSTKGAVYTLQKLADSRRNHLWS